MLADACLVHDAIRKHQEYLRAVDGLPVFPRRRGDQHRATGLEHEILRGRQNGTIQCLQALARGGAATQAGGQGRLELVDPSAFVDPAPVAVHLAGHIQRRRRARVAELHHRPVEAHQRLRGIARICPRTRVGREVNNRQGGTVGKPRQRDGGEKQDPGGQQGERAAGTLVGRHMSGDIHGPDCAPTVRLSEVS